MSVLCGALRLGLCEGVAGQHPHPQTELQQSSQHQPEDRLQLHPGSELLRGWRPDRVWLSAGAAARRGLQLTVQHQGQAR